MAYANLSWLIVALCEDLLKERDRLSDDDFLTKAEAAAVRLFEFGSDLPAVSSSLRKHRKPGELLPKAVVEVLVEATRREHPHFSFLIDQIGLFYVRAPEGPERDMALRRSYRRIPGGSTWPRLFSDTGKPKYNICSFYFVHGLCMDEEMGQILADSQRLEKVLSHCDHLEMGEKQIMDHYRSGKTYAE